MCSVTHFTAQVDSDDERDEPAGGQHTCALRKELLSHSAPVTSPCQGAGSILITLMAAGLYSRYTAVHAILAESPSSSSPFAPWRPHCLAALALVLASPLCSPRTVLPLSSSVLPVSTEVGCA